MRFIGGWLCAAALLVLMCGVPAQAAFQLQLIDTTPGCSGTYTNCSVTINDNGTGDLSNFAGIISFDTGNPFNTVTNVGRFSVVSTTDTSTAPEAGLTITTVSAGASAAGTLEIRISDTSFTAPSGSGLGLLQQLTLNHLPSGGGSVTGTGYQDNSDVLFGTENATPALTLSALGSNSVTGGPFTFAATYSMTEDILLTFNAATPTTNGLQVTANLSTVPEPASVALLGGVLLLSFGAIRRKYSR